MTVNAWAIGHHRAFDRTKTFDQQWQWIIELNDTDSGDGVTISPHKLLTVTADVIQNEPRALDEADLRALAVIIESALTERNDV